MTLSETPMLSLSAIECACSQDDRNDNTSRSARALVYQNCRMAMSVIPQGCLFHVAIAAQFPGSDVIRIAGLRTVRIDAMYGLARFLHGCLDICCMTKGLESDILTAQLQVRGSSPSRIIPVQMEGCPRSRPVTVRHEDPTYCRLSRLRLVFELSQDVLGRQIEFPHVSSCRIAVARLTEMRLGVHPSGQRELVMACNRDFGIPDALLSVYAAMKHADRMKSCRKVLGLGG